MKKVAVLGASSLIGSELTEKLKKSGYCVYALGRKNIFAEDVNYVKWNLYDSPENILIDKNTEYDSVIVAAWDGNQKNKRNDVATNMHCAEKLRNFLMFLCQNCCVGQIILCGSQAEYGNSCGVVTEEYKIDYCTLSAYGKAKLYLYDSLKEINICSSLAELRFHSVYGFSKYKEQMLQNVLDNIIAGKNISFYTDGKHHWDYIYVSDAATALHLTVENNLKGIYNVSSGEQMRFCDYMNTLNSITGNSVNIRYGEKKCSDFIFNSDKFRDKTGWNCKYDFQNGIKEMISKIMLSKE